jgi:hypothetical protein
MVDEEIKKKIMELRNEGKTFDEIAEITGIPKATIWRVIKKEEGEGVGGGLKFQNLK